MRKKGYYWLKFNYGRWVVGMWDGRYWRIEGYGALNDSVFSKIHETPITRNP